MQIAYNLSKMTFISINATDWVNRKCCHSNARRRKDEDEDEHQDNVKITHLQRVTDPAANQATPPHPPRRWLNLMIEHLFKFPED